MKKELKNIDDFLNEFTNKEFAFFYHYRFNQFTASSQEKIEKEKTIRNINQIEISDYVNNQKIILNDNCPRCQSSYKFEEVERVLIHSEYGSYEKDVFSWMCIVCSYNPGKHKPLNFRMWIRKLFNKYTRSKLV